jgi:hypothetical protein
MVILEYKLQATEFGMRCPAWIEDGGYFYNKVNFTYVGASKDNSEWYIPDTVITLTPLELEDRQVAIHNVEPMFKEHIAEQGNVAMKEAEVREAVKDWLASKT